MAWNLDKIKKFIGDDNDESENDIDQEDIEESEEDDVRETNNGRPKFVLRKPEERSELAEIAQDLINKKIVILNLEMIQKSEIRRFIDFLQGTIFALHGQMKKLSDATYIFIPGEVDIRGDILEDVEKLL